MYVFLLLLSVRCSKKREVDIDLWYVLLTLVVSCLVIDLHGPSVATLRAMQHTQRKHRPFDFI